MNKEMGKKNLDRLFQERLKDFSEIPDERVWESISQSLDKKQKKRRMIPFWWGLGGAAAALGLLLYLINPFDTAIESTPNVTDMEIRVIEDTIKDTPAGERSSPISEPGSTEVGDRDANDRTEEHNALRTDQRKGIVDDSKKETGTPDTNSLVRQDSPVSQDSVELAGSITDRSAWEAKNRTNGSRDTPENGSGGRNEGIAVNGSPMGSPNDTSRKPSDLGPTQPQKAGPGEAAGNEGREALANNEDKAIKESDSIQKKQSIYDAIAEQEEAEEALADANRGKWSAGPSIAPVYYNAMGQGSPVHSIFVANSKSGDINLSYGLSVAYAVTKKVRIRSGIHRVDFGYNTDDVEFTSTLDATDGQIRNINYTVTSKSLVVKSGSSPTANASEEIAGMALDVSADSPARSGSMSQQFGYIEVPLELDYALVDRKFGVNLIGGFSSLFLIDNSVSLSSGDLTTEMGEANNVNNVNISTNVGLGVNYNFSPKVQLNVEPMFKYQLNSFSETSGDFRPYSLGIYSGLRFTF